MSKIGQIRVKRYWPGKAPPDWADGAEEQTDLRAPSSKRIRVSLEQPDDSRLRRLAGILTVDRDEIRADHRRIRLAEVVVSAAVIDAATEEDEDEDAVEENRRRIRERLLKLRREADDNDDDDDDDEEEEESEYETDSDSEEACRRAIEKPVYVLKEERETIAERERLEAEVQALEEAVKQKIAETKQIVVENIRGDYEIEMSLVRDNVDTDDEANEYESWKAREIARIKRGREDREAMFKENTRPSCAPKQKWTFMHKYYHKGAFFQDDPAGIYNRDFSAPTGDDKLNKTILPKVMQVNHFGRSGRTKWTHLVNEDTTQFSPNNPPLQSKYYAKMAAMNTPIAKPKGSKKLNTVSSLGFWPS